MTARDRVPPAVSIVGRKNSGKTTLLVALAAELKRRGHRIATVKHGHPHFEVDRPGSDSWRHMHEGGADAVVIASAAKVALIERRDGEPDPEALIARLLAGRGYDLVLVEGYKRGPLPKIEVFRRAEHDRPIHDPREPDAARLLAVVTDDPGVEAGCPVVEIDGGAASEAGGADGLEAGAAATARAHAGSDDAASAGRPVAPGHIMRMADLLEERFLKVLA